MVELLGILAGERPADREAADERLALTQEEIDRFAKVAAALYLPYDRERGIDLQDERFLQLEPYDLQAAPPGGALNAVWSYDRILRTQLLRQGDVIVANLLLGDHFTDEQVRRDFDFYEPKTTHDSSLSFCHHAILAAQLGRLDMAYDYFLRTARLDLDDIHGNAWQEVHTACLAGTWQVVVLGFGGVRWFDGELSLRPVLPPQWTGYRFSLCWHGTGLQVAVRPGAVDLHTTGGTVRLLLHDQPVTATAEPQTVPCDTTGTGRSISTNNGN